MKVHSITKFVCGLLSIFSLTYAQDWPKAVVANMSVSDLYSLPLSSGVDASSVERRSQALYGEQMFAQEEVGGWYHVNSIEQPTYVDGKLVGLEGWLPADQTIRVDQFSQTNLIVSEPYARVFTGMDSANDESAFLLKVGMGTKLVGDSEAFGWWKVRLNNGVEGYIMDANVTTVAAVKNYTLIDLRSHVPARAKKLEGTPYLVGGLSASGVAVSGQAEGLDAAGFIHLVFRTCGIQTGRTIGDIYQGAAGIDRVSGPGDLLFFKDNSSGAVVHAMLVIDDNTLMEATGLVNSVRSISATERIGRPLDQIRSGEGFDNYTILLGTFFNHRPS